MALKNEAFNALAGLFSTIQITAQNLGLSGTDVIRQYGLKVLFEVLKAVEEKAIPDVDTSSEKKAAAMEIAGLFFDNVIGPQINVMLRPVARKLYMFAVSYLIDAAVSYVNTKFNGDFVAV